MIHRTSEGEKNKSRFRDWLDAVKDPYEGNMEMPPVFIHEETDDQLTERLKAKSEIDLRIFDETGNQKVRSFKKLYIAFSVIFCVVLAVLFVVTVSQLPPMGATDNPTVNEVVQRYLEQGLSETGAINIVAGMILDYRAFDTLGESHVLFTATAQCLFFSEKTKKTKKPQKPTERKLLNPKTILFFRPLQKCSFLPLWFSEFTLCFADSWAPAEAFRAVLYWARVLSFI